MKIIEDRLDLLSKNTDLVRMLLSESLRGSLAKEVDLPDMIFSSLKKGLEYHFKLKNQIVDVDFCARQLGGIFLSYVVLPKGQPFNKLTSLEKRDISRKHAQSVIKTIK